MAMVNMNNLLNGKDSRWLQLEVCREFQRNKCSRPDTECKFAHPPANVEVQNGRVTACYDSIKGRCNREKPPCKYFHPPQHLKDQLLINGRNHLALKNALMQQMGLAPGQPMVPGQVPTAAVPCWSQAGGAPFLGIPAQVAAAGAGSFSPFYSTASGPAGLLPVLPPDPSGASQLTVVGPQGVGGPQKMPRSDRLEMDVKSVGSFYYDNFAFPGMVPYKRAATDKSGVPVYQPGATTYQQLMTLQQQPYVPVTCEYNQASTSVATPSLPNTTAANSASALIVTSASSSSPTPSASVISSLPSATGGTSSPVPAASPQQQQQVSLCEQENGTDEDNENNNKQSSAQLLAAAATQSYLQAVKLASPPPSTSSTISSLTALNYTGVALNKQLLSPPQPRLPYNTNPTPQNPFSQHQQLLMRTANPSAQLMQPNLSYLNPFMAQQRLFSQQMINPYAMLQQQQQQQQQQPHHHPGFVPSAPLHHFHPYAHPLTTQQSLGSSQQHQQAMAAAAATAAAALSYKKMKTI